MWIIGNLLATVIYSCCLFYWLLILETNENNHAGIQEDAKLIHFSLSSFIFYCLFLIERVGTYTLNLF